MWNESRKKRRVNCRRKGRVRHICDALQASHRFRRQPPRQQSWQIAATASQAPALPTHRHNMTPPPPNSPTQPTHPSMHQPSTHPTNQHPPTSPAPTSPAPAPTKQQPSTHQPSTSTHQPASTHQSTHQPSTHLGILLPVARLHAPTQEAAPHLYVCGGCIHVRQAQGRLEALHRW
jgi:hypothetical protein